jgi:acyl transferase domain-containing protein/acyl-CoA synthetase (AMP-forming)/AMP-acid ligase II/acyl carrier protein
MVMPEDAALTTGTLLDLLQQRAQRYRDRPAFGFSHDGEEQHSSELTYRGLHVKARQIASSLQQQNAAGKRVLVLCPPGLDFIAGLFGCLYAGAIAVPVHPPMREHLVSRVASIVADVQPGFALTTAEVHTEIADTVDGLADGAPLRWCVVDAVAGDERHWVAPDIDTDTVAMVQYTSGSTSAPKGVVLTHGNLLHNLETIRQAWDGDDHAIGVFWLPPFHDMGLIGGILESLYVGATSVLMPPTAFIKNPMRWLETISRQRATITAAPNFAYDMCVDLSTPEQRAALDLSSWSTAMCGAEPVSAATLQRFADAFAPAGFRPEAFLPVYGLAEATLLVAGGSDSAVPIVQNLDRAALRDNRIVDVAPEAPTAAAFVGCGQPRGDQRVVIVDPETRRACQDDEVGEIWIAGPSVALGYSGGTEQSDETFSASLSDTGDGPFLRTGDLGFLRSGELFVTGRHKDLIIIRGNNHHPNDIELTVQDGHPALLRGRGAVFAVTPDSAGAEELVVVQEVDSSRLGDDDLAEIVRTIRAAVTEHHEIRAHAVVLTQPLQLPTTSSGKIQRSTCREQFLDDELAVVTAWQAPSPQTQPAAPTTQAGPPGAAQIADWLVWKLAVELQLPATEIEPSRPFAHYGLDSVHAVRLTTALEAWLGREVPPTAAYDYPTIDLLSDHLAQRGTPPAGESRADDNAGAADEPVAIIGIGCRFPGADGPAAFWRLLADGVDATSEIPSDRWDADVFYDPDPSAPGTAVSRRGGFLNGVDQFDSQFFGISPRESAQMDPQQRLLLETSWEAMEDGGQVPEHLAGSRTGVFVGISTNDYGHLPFDQPRLVDAYTGTGNASSIAANRLSYVFDFHGPSMAVDTACSSSLVAVDMACRSLRDGECTMALAGGVNIILSPALMINFTKAGVMAPDGRCKTFDAGADGYVRGEGAGVVVLKPLNKALADNDPVYSVIRGTATNSDGRTNGLAAPNGRSQESVLAEAYRRAGLPPGTAGYVEAHGTGTALGDAIEAKALGSVLADGRPPESHCLIGSVKTNIGHLEAAAGIAGLIKAALALHHRAIPPSLNFTEPNPHIPFDELPLDIAQTLSPWPGNGGRAIAGVSSFGFGGTNAHAVLAEAPQVRITPAAQDKDRAELLPLSARTPEALEELVGGYEMALVTGTPLADLCYTAGARRSHHEHRLCVIGESQAAMFESLAAYRHRESRPGLSIGQCRTGRPPGVTFVFSGQGSQWFGMGQRLRAEEPVFRDALAACDRALRPHLGCSVVTELTAGKDDSRLGDIDVLQPAIFAVQVALAALWRSWGVEPAAVVGHSMGEVAAAHVAGVLSLDDAARVISARARLLGRLRGPGAMMVAEATAAEAQELVAGREDQAAIAANNSCRSTVLSGDSTVLADLMAVLKRRDRFCRWIDVDVASHSRQVGTLGGDLRNALAGLEPAVPKVPVYSTVTGDLLGDRRLDADYWVDNLCSPVLFSAALRQLLDDGQDTLVEISPHPMLSTAAREDAADLGRSCTVLASMRRDDDGRATALASLGTLYTLGQPVDWEQLHPFGGRCIAAPTYPWQRAHSWLDAAMPDRAVDTHLPAGSDLLRWRGPLHSAVHPQTVLAEIEIDAGLIPASADYQGDGAAVLPTSLLDKIVLDGAAKAFGTRRCELGDVASHRTLEFTDGRPRTLQLVFRGDPATTVSFESYCSEPGSAGASPRWAPLASGTIDVGQPDAIDDVFDSPEPAGTGGTEQAPMTGEDLRERAYQLRWQPASISSEADESGHTVEAGTWLVFSDGSTTADTLRDHLEAQSGSCVVVTPGTDYQRFAPDSYRLDPTRPEHFRWLFADAFDGGRTPCCGVVHLWSLLAEPPADTSTDWLESATVLGPLSAVGLVQALSSTGWPTPPRLWLVTRGAQVVNLDSGNASIAQAPIWGLGRSIDHEHPELQCTRVDLSTDGGPEELRALFQEIRADGPEVDVALRGCRRYAARLARYDDSDAPRPNWAEGVAAEADGTYLITGGLGALGLEVATWLVGQGARHLALMGRSAGSQTAQAAVDSLREAGAEVLVARGDVTRPDDVASVLESIGASMPPLRGVVHAAGTVDDAILQNLDERRLRNVMAPKVQGAWNMHRLTLDAKLDFFVLFSSAASVLGLPGAANYGAANAFLDALAWHRRGEGRPALSINWGPWAGLGFFTRSELNRHFTDYGVAAVPAPDCLRALSSLLRRTATQATVLDIDWERWCTGKRRPLLQDLRHTPETSPVDRTARGPGDGLYDALQNTAPQQRRQLLETYLRDLTATKLGLSPSSLNIETPLSQLGVDSLITLELRIQIEHDLGIVVPVARLMDGPTVAGVSGWLTEQLAETNSAGTDSTPTAAATQAPRHIIPVQAFDTDASNELDLLTHVPDLSDDTVDELLRKVIAGKEGNHDG